MAACFVTRQLPGDAVERLAAVHRVELWPGELPPSRAELLAGAREAEGLLCLLTDRVDAELLDGCPRLRAIANLAVGTDNIDLAECERRGIAVGNTPEVLTETTADLAFALLLAAARRVVEGAEAVRAGRWRTWEPAGWLGHDAHGATLGIVGAGRIGRAVGRRAVGFEIDVLYAGSVEVEGWRRTGGGAEAAGASSEARAGMTPLDRLLARSDFVSLHCPLTESTRHLIDEAALRTMKPTAVLVNTARGEVVDSEALGRALTEGWIAGAALDVTEPEPLPADHPLLEAPNLLVVPHIGSATHATREAMASIAADNLLAALAGEPMPHGVSSRPGTPRT